MPHVIAWCGFPGAWLLVAGPLDRAVREIAETELEIGEAMPDEDLLAFLTVKDILNAWLYVAAGASLIAVKEILCVGTTIDRALRRRERPATD